jgi:antibiotic biosynthesis monooxygenase (ABM) superfamily enzyme
MEIWDNSPYVQTLLKEANRYLQDATRQYDTATSLETWFVLPDLKTVVPPKVGNGNRCFIAAYTTSLLSRSFLSPVFSEWPLVASTIISTILVVSLTYFALPV